jgi:hypothetical protein
MLTKSTIQEAKSTVKNLVRQRCAKRFNSGVKELMKYNMQFGSACVSCRFASYAVQRLHMTHAHTNRKLLPLPLNASCRLCRPATVRRNSSIELVNRVVFDQISPNALFLEVLLQTSTLKALIGIPAGLGFSYNSRDAAPISHIVANLPLTNQSTTDAACCALF